MQRACGFFSSSQNENSSSVREFSGPSATWAHRPGGTDGRYFNFVVLLLLICIFFLVRRDEASAVLTCSVRQSAQSNCLAIVLVFDCVSNRRCALPHCSLRCKGLLASLKLCTPVLVSAGVCRLMLTCRVLLFRASPGLSLRPGHLTPQRWD